MKKVSTLLLTGLIGSSMLFAGFTGSATVSNELFNLDTNAFGISNSTEWDGEVELSASTGEAKGEGDIYAEISATLTLTSSALDETTVDAAGDLNSPTISAVLEYVSANIVGDTWSVSILGAAGPYNYAADAINLDDDGYAYNYGVYDSGKTDGVAVTLNDLGTVSVGYTGAFDDLTATKGYVALEAAEMEISEGMTAQVAASLAIDKDTAVLANQVEVGASAKLAYAADDYSASVALDAGYDAADFGMDASLNVAYSPLTLDAYFGTTNTNGDFTTTVDNVLHVIAVTDLASFDVPVTLTLTGLDLVNAQDLTAKACLTVNEELSTYVSGGYVIDTTSWSVGAGATYTVEDYTAVADVSLAKGSVLAASASVESTTLVDGATLTLGWADGADLLHKVAYHVDDNPTDLGSITASCTIAFE